LALVSSILMAFAMVVNRHLHEIHQCITIVGFGAFGAVQTAILAWSMGVMEFPTETMDILQAIAIGLLSCSAQLLIIIALKYENAGPIALVKTTEVLHAFILQMVVMQQLADWKR
jgi:drug/metabolite transporter (DMT)-like permease